jgi:hypothetical protein
MVGPGWVEALLIVLILALAAVGVPAARRFLYGVFHGTNVFVFVPSNGKTVIYKNPREWIGLEDPPLEALPPEVAASDRYEEYYNVCWFDSGTLLRCKHSYHRKPENALYCEKTKMDGFFIARVLEER